LTSPKEGAFQQNINNSKIKEPEEAKKIMQIN
jgi:hypothetical protein